jgi:hypothetical protein
MPVEYFRVSFTTGINYHVYATGIRAAKKIARSKANGGTIRAVSVLRESWINLYRKGAA